MPMNTCVLHGVAVALANDLAASVSVLPASLASGISVAALTERGGGQRVQVKECARRPHQMQGAPGEGARNMAFASGEVAIVTLTTSGLKMVRDN